MTQVLYSRQMQELDNKTISEFGLSAAILMENAGKGCADFIKASFEEASSGRVVILHGTGNNSGDGFVIARWLCEYGFQVALMQLGEGKFSPVSQANYQLCTKLNIRQYSWQNDAKLCSHLLQGAAVIVDAVFGTGFKGKLPTPAAEAFAEANSSLALRIAIDIPSGVAADTGEASINAFQAHHTLAIHAYKTGHLLHDGKRHSGSIHLIPIGIPELYYHVLPIQELITEANCHFPHRDPQAHKGTYGKVLIIGGSPGFTGSVALAATAALRSGAGYVYLASRKELEQHYSTLSPEIMFRPLPAITGIPDIDEQSLKEFIASATAILIGPGLGLDTYAKSMLEQVLSCAKVPMIIDADAISLLATNEHLQALLKREDILLTPHPGEFCRISAISPDALTADTVGSLQEFCRKTGLKVLLKGDTSIYCEGSTLLFNTRGNDGLATGGSGDVLAGIIVSFVAQGLKLSDAAINASYLMGITAEQLATKRGTPSIIPSDIIANLFC